jgi:hypothetical protein
MSNLAEAIMQEITRVRDQVLPLYLKIGAPGMFAAMMMCNDLDRATKALAEGDVVECLRVYESLKGYHT